MRNVTYPEKERNVADITVDGISYAFVLPPATGTHSECFQAPSSRGIIAQGKEIAAYITGALDPQKKNEWQDINLIRFPTQNYLRFPNVLTIVPITEEKKFGDLEGAMLIDEDLRGLGINIETEVPKDLDGWVESPSGVLHKDKRIAVLYDKWYADSWDAKNGAVIGLFGEDGGEIFERTAIDTHRGKFMWNFHPAQITIPIKRVSVVNGYYTGGLSLVCNSNVNGRYGCAVRVLK